MFRREHFALRLQVYWWFPESLRVDWEAEPLAIRPLSYGSSSQLSSEKPDRDYSLYETESDSTSKDVPPLANRNEITCGLPKHKGQHVVSKLNPSRQEEMCDSCGQNAAVKICLTCNNSFCESHAREHHELLSTHTLAAVSRDLERRRSQLGQQYTFSVATQDEDGHLSQWVTERVTTAVPPPQTLTKRHSEATSLSLQWTKGENMEGIPHQFLIKVTSPGKEPHVIYTKDCYKMFSDLEPDTEYEFSVSTVLKDNCSDPVYISVHTEPCLREFLSRIGLEDQYDRKLSVSDFLEITQNDTSEDKTETLKSLCEAFLKSLLMLNINARNVKSVCEDLEAGEKNTINPLDLITAVFLCSDSFLQQDLALKMALCQFAVPLLLPNSETREITMMLWSLRGIVQTFRPSQQAFMKLNCEERLVLFDLPLISFVRLGKRFMSKSAMLNKLLSNAEHYHDRFCHSELVCGDVPRKISDGLVEVSWYLPCGNRSTDQFSEPLAVANLRGDLQAFDKQFSFLCQTSTAVYIFCDESKQDYLKNFEGKHVNANIILVSSRQGKTSVLKTMTTTPSLKTTVVSQRNKTHTELLQALQKSVSKILESNPNKMSLASLAEQARCCEIMIDEDCNECQSAWENAHKITSTITETSEFKEQELPSQGHTWKALSWLETEHWRLRKVGNRNTEEYQMSLKTKEKELKKRQQRFDVSAAMLNFLEGFGSSAQRRFFLKWLEMELDDLSRHQLSTLQDRYKEQNKKSPKNTETIAEIDKQISVYSLRVDHFFRECGQLYVCSSSLPEYSKRRKAIEQLPALYAQMVLDGFPLELVDGDAANIPMKWITDVLTELHYILDSNSQLKVITTIGAENSGKSTLLNTMFGVRFAFNKGTCTRGAFMQLVRVSKDVRRDLGCDCILIIDTEGLKQHQMVQNDHSHERDKEVASLALALSDAAIVSVSKDGCTDSHILKVVLHALTRLEGVDRKLLCHFVHVNISGMSADEKKGRDKELLEKLNVMIQRNTEMKKDKKLSDVMELHPNTWSWNIPPIWKGTPPMAPLNVDFSETAQALKKQLLWGLKKYPVRGDLTHFIKKIETLWKAV
ncbi:up-regulator of cell proliferation-like [Melanotaenia boesemani]|uniref:up-regulator of cell proliferation-like n=1 Tax=Melanotaenia boesemani TaxID=1250792 RepID=UPI001C0404F6|nr:up-regulator of cell proliferation-like [Melanotaenia boesemani]